MAGRNLSDTDLQLYLAGALPPGKRLLLALALQIDVGLKARLESLKADNAAFAGGEMARLRGRLFPAARTATATPSRGAASTDGEGFSWRNLFPQGGRSFGYAMAGSFAVLALCAVPFLGQRQQMAGFGEAGPDLIAKGTALGVTLFVKGDSAYRVENHQARVAPADTLQAMPLGTQPQHLALFGWDPAQGLVRLFPSEGAGSRQVSPTEPPPALLLQGMDDNRLICVTANAPFKLAQAEALLKKKPFTPLSAAPATHLARGLYMQVFSIAKRAGGRI